MIDKRSLGIELGKALRGALAPNNLNRSLYVTLADGQPIWVGNTPEAFVRDAYLYNPDVFSVINLISRSASAVPWVLHEVKDKKSYSKYLRMPSDAKRHNLTGVMYRKDQAMEEVDGHPLMDLLRRPNPYMGMAEMFEAIIGYKLITGNSYLHGVKIQTGRDAGKFGELWVMPAHLTEIVASNDPEYIIRGYKLNWYGGTEVFEIPADEVLHFKYFNPDYSSAGSHLYGMSPLQSARRVVTRSNEAYTANAKMLKNMSPPGILMLDDDNVEQFTETQASELEKQWQRKIGSDKAGKVMVTGARMKWQALGLSPVDLNILESQKMDLRDICNVYGVSSELLNDPDNKTNSNKRESRMALYYETIIPELDLIRDELNRWLTKAWNVDGKTYHLDYDISSIPALQADIEKQTRQLADAWWIKGNEKRVAQGFDTDPVMDQYFVPSNLVPVMGELDLEETVKRLNLDDYAKR
jgi:HK97 family phage portal protein